MSKVKMLTLTGFFMSLVTIVTAYLVLPIAWGYLNLGDAIIMLLATTLPSGMMFLIGGFGSAFADVLLGYSQYALFTFVIKGLEGVLVVFLYQQSKMGFKHVFPFLIAGLWIGLGYALTDAFLFQDISVGIASFGYNLLQGLSSAAIAIGLHRLVSPFLGKLWTNNRNLF